MKNLSPITLRDGPDDWEGEEKIHYPFHVMFVWGPALECRAVNEFVCQANNGYFFDFHSYK